MIRSEFLTDSSRWAAVSNRDPNADGCFIYCVKTTKIYCRPICQARLARRSNVEFVDNPEEAEAAGYRACKRCDPRRERFIPNTDKVIRKVCVRLDQLQPGTPVPSLDTLASIAGMTKYHFHRSFKKITGLTPREYVASKRDGRNGMTAQTPDLLKNPGDQILDQLSSFPESIETSHDGISPFSDILALENPPMDDFLSFDPFDYRHISLPELDPFLDFCVNKDISGHFPIAAAGQECHLGEIHSSWPRS